MSTTKHEAWLHVSAGHGPAECAWAVVQTLEEIRREAEAASLECAAMELSPGSEAGTAESVLLTITGNSPVAGFVESWCGTVQWIARSPFRPKHKRKNWFVSVEAWQPAEETRLRAEDLRWETMRASGPGGQHVNRTESAVRTTHAPTGLQGSAMEERSQHRNRKLALARLAKKIDALNAGRAEQVGEERWRAHRELERGNAVRVFQRRT